MQAFWRASRVKHILAATSVVSDGDTRTGSKCVLGAHKKCIWFARSKLITGPNKPPVASAPGNPAWLRAIRPRRALPFRCSAIMPVSLCVPQRDAGSRRSPSRGGLVGGARLGAARSFAAATAFPFPVTEALSLRLVEGCTERSPTSASKQWTLRPDVSRRRPGSRERDPRANLSFRENPAIFGPKRRR